MLCDRERERTGREAEMPIEKGTWKFYHNKRIHGLNRHALLFSIYLPKRDREILFFSLSPPLICASVGLKASF